MINKKAASGTLMGVFFAIFAVLAIFFGAFGFIANAYSSAGIVDEVGYIGMNETMSEWEGTLTTQVDDISVTAQEISEADATVLQVAWNGITGLAKTLRLFFDLTVIGVGIWTVLVPGLNFLPTWVILIVELAITMSVILIVIGAFKGEAKT